jgi:hypothetical protein
MRIRLKTGVHLNFSLFIVFSFFFGFLQQALQNRFSVFQEGIFFKHMMNEKIMLVWILVIIFSNWRFKKFAFLAGTLFVTSIIFDSCLGLVDQFNRFSFAAIFFYSLISFFILVIYYSEITEAAYNPLISKSDIKKSHLNNIRCTLSVKRGEQVSEYFGIITNWDKNGCFLFLETPIENFFGQCELVIDFEGKKFKNVATISGHGFNRKGVGLQFLDSEEEKTFNWKELYRILESKGFLPELVF